MNRLKKDLKEKFQPGTENFVFDLGWANLISFMTPSRFFGPRILDQKWQQPTESTGVLNTTFLSTIILFKFKIKIKRTIIGSKFFNI